MRTAYRTGWVGLGKLGLPSAIAQASRGIDVCGTDLSPKIREHLEAGSLPYQEPGAQRLLDQGHAVVWCNSVADVVRRSDVVFLAVQTPHGRDYEGVTEAPAWERRDFEYAYLETAFRSIVDAASDPIIVAVVSTVLPGTVRRRLMPARGNVRVVYNPSFIAMGTCAEDYLDPEFTLLGADDPRAAAQMVEFYEQIHDRPVIVESIEAAELAKVAYNTMISLKIIWANSIMEICEGTAADCDGVSSILEHATKRLWSPAYTRGGMGDGGACHPRDNIALSWLAERLGLSADPFKFVTKAREAQSRWLADLARRYADDLTLPVFVCGPEYKAETNITTGSASRLLAEQLGADFLDGEPTEPAVFVIGCNHRRFAEYRWPAGSVILDPWGYVPDQAGVTVRRIGRK